MTEDMEDEPLRPGVNVRHGERFLRGEDLEPVMRDDLELALIAAWMNVRVEQLPAKMRAHTCQATKDAWGRVAAAARDHIAKNRQSSTEEVERLREAITRALQCTPHVQYAHNAEATIVYDCGDPWENLRTALTGASTHD